MRILVVQESDWIGRNPIQQHQMLERLSLQGHDVLVLDYPIRWRDEGRGLVAPRRVHRNVAKVIEGAQVTVIRSASLRVSGLGKLAWLATNTRELVHAFDRFQPDIVLSLGLSNSLVAVLLAKQRGIPVVVHLVDALHTLAEPQALWPVAARVERAILERADQVVAINRALSKYAVEMGAAAERVTVIPTGADLQRFGPQVDGSSVRAEHGLNPDDHVMLFMGWLYTFTGLKELAEAMAADELHDSRLRLLIVGDGDLLPELEQLRDTALGSRLILTGKQPASRIPEFLAAADVCLLPAHVNRTMQHIVPAKIYEYLAAGKPIIATPLDGLVTEFGHTSGIHYAAGANAVLEVAKELLANAPRYDDAARLARVAAEETGSWDQVTARFERVLTSVVRPPLLKVV